MRRAFPRLESVILGAIPVTILVFAFGSSSVDVLRTIGQPLRWAALLALLLLASALALARRRLPKPAGAYVAAAALVVVAGVSTLWSVAPLLTAARTVSFAVLLATAAALASATASDGDARRVLAAVLAGATLVAAAGVALYLFDHAQAVQAATAETPARLRGIGENPNTVPMLLAIALPVSTLFVLDARTRARGVAAGAAFLLLAGSIVASGSRGGLVAAFAGAFIVAAGVPHGARRRAAAAALVAGLFAAAVMIIAIPDPIAPSDLPVRAAASFPKNAERGIRLEDEIGRPRPASVAQKRRSLLGLSGRDEAWGAGIDHGRRRPVAGYGFGTEDRVFVDRLFSFQGGRPEQSFIGMFIQLGIVGLLLLLALLVAVGVACARVVAGADPRVRAVGVACGGALVAMVALALAQSFVYAAGNISTLSAWICVFLPLSLARIPPSRNPDGRRRVLLVTGLLALLVALVAVGLWEGRRHARDEAEAMAETRAQVGPLDQPSLAAYRLQVGVPDLSCLLYRREDDPYALELCFDDAGRLVEAIDRRGLEPRIASLREEPTASTIRVDPRAVRMLLRRLGAPVAA